MTTNHDAGRREGLLEAIEPIREFVRINDGDTLSSLTPDDNVIATASGSWSGSAHLTWGHLRTLVRVAAPTPEPAVCKDSLHTAQAPEPVEGEAGQTVQLPYTNYRGEFAKRPIKPIRLFWGSNEWHPEPQWLIEAWDVGKGAIRYFALKGFGQGSALAAAPTPEPVDGLEPPGCPTPGACSCPGGEAELARRLGEAQRALAASEAARKAAEAERDIFMASNAGLTDDILECRAKIDAAQAGIAAAYLAGRREMRDEAARACDRIVPPPALSAKVTYDIARENCVTTIRALPNEPDAERDAPGRALGPETR